ncbi:uncharacterized protein G2W53_035570 [Senna tora]|uniref:Uncharacterized protein n=1 Tax=Senna tora TaxID=362788 RepID=A0A834SRW5_9FABA|nr:uncharacterized protein G2W53_035570 [Senna tora]
MGKNGHRNGKKGKQKRWGLVAHAGSDVCNVEMKA